MPIVFKTAYGRWAFWLCLAVVLVIALAPPRVQVPPTGWDKVNHLFAFAVLTVLGRRAYPGYPAPMMLGLLAYGALIEVLQHLTGYRTAELLDLLADGAGLVIGWQAAWLAGRLRRLR